MPKLTKRTIDGLEPRPKEYFAWDEEMPRFGVRIMPTGRKSYVIQYRAPSGQRRHRFAQVGIATPEEARNQARQLLAAVDRGEDPSGARQAERTAPNMAELGARFLAEHVAHRCKPSTQREYRRAVELFINPAIGARKVADITRVDIAQLHQADAHRPYQANRTLGVLSMMFGLAETWGLRPDGSNPCRKVAKYRETKREHYLAADTFARLGATLDACERDGSESPHVIAAIRLLATTGCRLGEIMGLRWAEVQPGYLALPDSKTGAKRVPLGTAAAAVLAAVPRMEGNPYVIVGALPGARLTDLQRPWRRIRALAGLGETRIHDLRHSFASAAVSANESLPIVGKMLGHSQPQTTQRYAHLRDDPVAAAANRTAAGIAAAMGLAGAATAPEAQGK